MRGIWSCRETLLSAHPLTPPESYHSRALTYRLRPKRAAGTGDNVLRVRKIASLRSLQRREVEDTLVAVNAMSALDMPVARVGKRLNRYWRWFVEMLAQIGT